MKLDPGYFNLNLSKDQTQMLKAIGILLIVIHNFSRWVYPITGESEFYFNPTALSTALQVGKTDVWMFLKAFFNYFGHYGVQIFVFLSGYGLVKSYQEKQPKWTSFVFHRFQKLYPSLVIAIIVYLIYQVFVLRQYPDQDIISNLVAYLTFTATLLPGKGLSLVGPWWFYATIFQLYLLFPFLIRVYSKHGTRWLLFIGFIAWLITRLHALIDNPYDVNLLETFVGQMPVFILGIWFGANNNLRVKWQVLLVLLFIFFLGCYFSFFWPLTRLSITILLIIAGNALIAVANKVKPLNKFLLFTGSISVYLFALHGFMRWPFVYIINLNQDKKWIGVLIFILFLVLSFSAAWFFTRAEDLWRKKLHNFESIFPKVTLTSSLILLPAILLVWGYYQHFNVDKSPAVSLMNNIEEYSDYSETDITDYKTENGEKVIWLRTGEEISTIRGFKIPVQDFKNSNRLIISSKAYFDSIPEKCWLIVESYRGDVSISKNSIQLELQENMQFQWQSFLLMIDLRSPLVFSDDQFQYYFYAKTNGNIYFDEIEVMLQ